MRHPFYVDGPNNDLALLRLSVPFDVDGFGDLPGIPTMPLAAGDVGTVASSKFDDALPVAGSHYVGQWGVSTVFSAAPGNDPSGQRMQYALSSSSGACVGDSGSGHVVVERGRRTVSSPISTMETVGASGCTALPSTIFVPALADPEYIRWIEESMRAWRRPNTALSMVGPTCRSAPSRVAGRRADVAELWAENDAFGMPRSSLAVHPSTGSVFATFEEWARMDGQMGSEFRYAVGDVDSDGAQDLVSVWNQGGSVTLTVRRSTAGSFVLSPSQVTSVPWSNDTEWLPGDFDGDGAADLMQVWKDGGDTSFGLWRWTGAGFVRSEWRYKFGGWVPGTKWAIGDFDGDGRDDVLAAWKNGANTSLAVRRRENGSLVAQQWTQNAGVWDARREFMAGQFDGTGFADVVMIGPDAANMATFTIFPNQTGMGFGSAAPWMMPNGGWVPGAVWRSGDFDGDGRDEILSIWSDTGAMTTLTMRRKPAGVPLTEHWARRRVVWQGSSSWCAGSFDHS